MNAQDVLQLAEAVIAKLAPFTPFLIEGGKKFAGSAGDAAWQKAQELWGKLKPVLTNEPKLVKKIEVLAIDPQDQEELTSLVKTLAVKLKEHEDLIKDLSDILGGSSAVQKVIVTEGNWLEDVTQQSDNSSEQIIRAGKDNVLKGIKQISNSK
jgi:hypothetical protein